MARKAPGAAASKPTPAPAAAPAPEVDQVGAPPAAGDATDPSPDATETPETATEQIEQPVEAPPVDLVEPESAAAPAPDLDDFIAHHERAAQAVDLVVTAISHPGAKPRHHAGVYSGFPITTGQLLATYNDGSTH